jgi:hypothetical protein
MITRVRAGVVGLLSLLAGAGACESSAKKLPCSKSIADACPGSGFCPPLSWADASSGTAFCSQADISPPAQGDCGAYHVVTISHLDTSAAYYYDVATGMLVAIVGIAPPAPMAVCAAGPAAGFTLPTCTGPLSEPLPQCLDGGTDATLDGPSP